MFYPAGMYMPKLSSKGTDPGPLISHRDMTFERLTAENTYSFSGRGMLPLKSK